MSRHWLGKLDLLGYILCRGRQRPSVLEWLRRDGVHAGSQLLDVGSGAGHLLFSLRGLGFSRLIGVDPFVATDRRFPGSITVLKREINDMTGMFDYIVLNHSFEHMNVPVEVLKHVRRLIAPSGRAMISTPMASSFAWRQYGVDWVQLDAPRHLFVHTEKSIRSLANQAGLRVSEVVYDSTEFQFWGSEQYRAGIPLRDARSYARSPRRSIFTPEQIAGFRRRAQELNAAGEGDSASFYLEATE
jgi:SAM-dependent methyltransferase